MRLIGRDNKLNYGAFKEINRKYSKDINMQNLNRDLTWKIKSAEKHRELALNYGHKGCIEKCPICGRSNHVKFVTIYGFDYEQCLNCGHIYLRDIIGKKEMKQLYQGGQNKSLQHTVYLSEELFEKRVEQIASPKVEWVSSEVKKKGLWIDIGCGTGEILFAAQGLGYKVLGIDADTEEIEFARCKGINIICDYVSDLNAHNYLVNGNIISLFNILEHLENPVSMLENISANIMEGTYIVMEIPRHPSISSFSNLIFNEMACRHIYPPDHIHIFTEKSAEIMLKKAKLKPINVWTFGQDISDFIMTASASKNITKSSFIDDLMSVAPVLQKRVDELGFSDTMIIICKK